MNRCKRCVMSDTRPRVVLNDEGVCPACIHKEAKKNTIDWEARKKEFLQLIEEYRCKDGSRYDCVVGVSGGKDSSYVAWRLKYEFGMNPLCVTFAPSIYTDIGRQNLENFKNAGFDHILVSPSPKVDRILVKKAFVKFGDVFLPFIYGINATPVKVAINYGISLVFYSENAEFEYGGSRDKVCEKGKTIESISKYSKSGQDMLSWLEPEDGITLKDVLPYRMPSEDEIRKANLRMPYFGYYFEWDPDRNFRFAQEKCNFSPIEGRSEGTYTNFASLDDKIDGVHYYLMYVKFGIGRANSDAAHHVRDGVLSRKEAMELVRKYDDEFPVKHFREFLEYVDMTEAEFWKVVDSFRNKDLWEKVDGKWVIPYEKRGLA